MITNEKKKVIAYEKCEKKTLKKQKVNIHKALFYNPTNI